MKYFELQDELYKPEDRWFLGNINFTKEGEFWKYLTSGEVEAPSHELKVL